VSASSPGPGLGATFTIELPMVTALEPSPERERPLADVGNRLRGVRVLVVNDRDDERTLFAEMLGRHGVVVAVADGVPAALRELEQFRPTVIVSDIAMPGQDGCEFVRRLRKHADPALARIPAVAVTAQARAEDRKRALSAGFDDYVSKPVRAAELVAVVADVAVRVSRGAAS
jgi:CheY-like chemotaxis protein